MTTFQPFTFLGRLRPQQQEYILSLASPHQSFKSVEAMDNSLLHFVDCHGLRIGETALKILEFLSRHSLKVIGVSWLSTASLAEMADISDRTLQRILNRLEKLGIIKRLPTVRPDGGQGINLIVIQPQEVETVVKDQVAGPDLDHGMSQAVTGVVAEPVTGNVAQDVTHNLKTQETSESLEVPKKRIDRLPHSQTRAVASRNQPNGEFSDRSDILDALLHHGKSLGTVLETYFASIYSMLMVRFPKQLDPTVIEIACRRYIEKYHDMVSYRPRFQINDPVAWFHDAYRESIFEWKAGRYKVNKMGMIS